MPQSAVQLGKQATPNASRAMPATRANGLATPASWEPSNNRTTNEGITIRATPMAASATAAIVSTFFIVLVIQGGVAMRIDEKLLRLRGFLVRLKFESQLVDLAVELERRIVAILPPSMVRGLVFRAFLLEAILHLLAS